MALWVVREYSIVVVYTMPGGVDHFGGTTSFVVCAVAGVCPRLSRLPSSSDYFCSTNLACPTTSLVLRQHLFELIAKFRSLHVHVRCDTEDDEPWVRGMVSKLCQRIHGLKSLEITLDCRQPLYHGYVQESYYEYEQHECWAACSIIMRKTRRDKEFPARPTIPQAIVNVLRPFSMLRAVSHVIFHGVPTEFAQDLENKVRSTTPNPALPIYKQLQRDIRELKAAKSTVGLAMELDEVGDCIWIRQSVLQAYKKINNQNIDSSGDGTSEEHDRNQGSLSTPSTSVTALEAG